MTTEVQVLPHDMLGGPVLYCVTIPHAENTRRWETIASFSDEATADGFAAAARRLPVELVREYLDI